MSARTHLAAVASVLATVTVALAALPAQADAAASATDWISVTHVQVNRLGGVTVSGEVSCAGTYAKIAAGDFQYQDEDGNTIAIQLQPGDKVDLLANSDNYTVSQPAGRKTMIQATHHSSRMNPCYVQYPYQPDGTPMPDWIGGVPEGTPNLWETDEYGYDHATLPPLFDYASNGRFKAGLLNVAVQSIGLYVMVAHFTGATLTGWDFYYVPDGSFAAAHTTIKAVPYRG